MKKYLLLPAAIGIFVLFIISYIIMSSRSNMIFPHGSDGAEKRMAKQMGISVKELRNQTPEEHMKMMTQHQSPAFAGSDAGQVKNIDVSNLPEVLPTEVMEVKDGDTVTLNPTIVRKMIDGKAFAMYGYNGQIPGPIIQAKQGSSITVNVTNNIDMETTVHWHGLRHDNKDDGVPDLTQPAIEPSGSYSYTVRFPDEGIYWYHPHVREDLQQDLGLYGNILVRTNAEDAYSPTNSEEILILDDITSVIPKDTQFALMGRFGTQMLVNGETDYQLSVQRGSVVRFYLTNVANTRTFKIRIDGGAMKRVGSDLGRYENEEWVDTITIAPAERYIVDVLFEDDGQYKIQHESPLATYDLGSITVTNKDEDPSYDAEFNTLKSHEDVIADIDSYRKYFDAPVDKTLVLDIDMLGMDHGMMMQEAHTSDGIEWEDSMTMMNAMSNEANTRWKLIDEETGKENMDIHWQFTKGDIVKIRIVNSPDSAHPMQHPIHLHGQRFLVLSEDGIKNDNLVWKDTVLVPSGRTTNILVDMSNPGDWMMHCHIAEHLTNGMMGMFTVSE